MSFGDAPKEVGRLTDFSFRARLTLKPLTSGTHRLSLAAIGPARLFVDGVEVLRQSGAFEEKSYLFFTYGSGETIASLPLIADQEYQVSIECLSHDRQLNPGLLPLLEPMEEKFQGFRLGYEEANARDLPAEAAELASGCDAAIVVVGRDKEWETEGHDIPLFELPGDQVQLIRSVAARCKRTIVVVQAGTPVRMEPWVHDVQAVLYTWYQGQELGNAAAQVITGKVNPSGRLPVTFPREIWDCPAYSSFPGEQNETRYAEGIFVGYRWWDLVGTKPQYPIGFGLFYNNFTVRPGAISSTVLKMGTTLKATAVVRNTGGYHVAGRQTILLWVRQASSRGLVRPVKQICGFAKSAPLGPEEEQAIEMSLDAYVLGTFDPERKKWVVDAGSEFDILLGTDAEQVDVAWRISVPEEISWVHELGKP